MASATLNVSGSIWYASGPQLRTALAPLGFSVKDQGDGDEFLLVHPAAVLEAYLNSRSPKGIDFLVSGSVEASPPDAHQLFEQVGAALEQSDLLYHFELEDEGAPEGVRVIEHPRLTAHASMSGVAGAEDALLERLRGADVRRRVAALRALMGAPRASLPAMAAVEALLDDRTPTILSLPIRIGEVRFLAAETLAALRARIPELRHDVVVLDPGYPTLSPVELGPLARAAGCDTATLDPPAQYAWLRDHGGLQAKRLEFHPMAYLE
ncbi:MAG: hypothetical protein JNJ54_11550 [Myxococcaceae bacterium]|nr:hypothetical protein [Myxococcaceae bacterium]